MLEFESESDMLNPIPKRQGVRCRRTRVGQRSDGVVPITTTYSTTPMPPGSAILSLILRSFHGDRDWSLCGTWDGR
uniref:Uncharacterized protein n=1 Tax=Neurospora crassa TaxID=5141 RepID=Q6M9I0_NEUCS|nr:hypothetical protein [Neurospora crassa]